MKKTFSNISLALLALFSVSCGNKVKPVIPSNRQIEKNIDAIMARMTLEDKIGQMTQITSSMFEDFDYSNPDCKGSMREDILDTLIRVYRVGSFINIPFGQAQDPETWNWWIRTIQDKSMQELGIPTLFGLDMIHGASYTKGATFFPQSINLAATFDTQWSFRCNQVNAYETRACQCPWVFEPVLDLERNQCWSRIWESYGEDPLVNARMGSAAVKGLQGDDPNKVGLNNVAACIKHFMGYGAPVSGKDRTPSSIQPYDLREKFFAPFLAAMQNGALSIMVSSSSNGAVPYHANAEILTKWVKEELGWDGLIVTDWADIDNLWSRDHVAETQKEAVRIAINAGIDMAMVPSSWQFCIDLKELVNEGKVPMSRIDDAVRRVLRLKYRLGLFDTPEWDGEAYDRFASAESAQLSREAAEESIVLLKNEGNVLPIRKGTRILVTGPNSNSVRCLNGGWSYTWQGSSKDEFVANYNTIAEAMAEKFGASNVKCVPGVQYPDFEAEWWVELEPDINSAVAAASGVDLIVACIGENSYCETPGNLNELTISENQSNLVKALAKTGKPIVLVINEGRPRVIRDIEPLASAVVDIMLPGNYGADALSNLLAGEVNFSGKLPFSYPMYTNALTTYDYKPSEKVGTMSGDYNYNARVDMQWTFGSGLSYTTYEYSDFKADKTEFGPEDVLNLEITVKNTGNVAGRESVLLFSSDLYASIMPDAIRLRDFTKIDLQPGESKVVKFALPASELAFVGLDGKWVVEEGDFRLSCGGQAITVHNTATKKWDTPNR